MTIFAGAFSLTPTTPIPPALAAALGAHLSRHPQEQVATCASAGWFLAKVDIGAFPTPALHQDGSGSVTAIAGEALLRDGERWSRRQETSLIHGALLQDQVELLQRAQGTFCGAHYNAARHSLQLFADKTGVRPLYYTVFDGVLVFATALRILEAIEAVPKEFDLQGVTEITAYSYALADRTAYRGIKLMRAGELLRAEGGKTASRLYWRWDTPPAQPYEHEQAVGASYRAFVAAIARRHGANAVAAAFLSGGLDSRAIVGGLQAAGAEVYTVNYAPDGTQDQVFAELVATQLGVDYTQLQTTASNVAQSYRKDSVAGWIAKRFAGRSQAQVPRLMWSGDGGSVALGHVYLKPDMVAAMERGATREALLMFNRGLRLRIFRGEQREPLYQLSLEGAEQEIAAIGSADPGRRFHLFLMFNDQRRHLDQHFENLDLERIEFQLPFFDAGFLETILRYPVAPFLQHRFYMDWIARFPNQLNAVPWQAYPGHVPCTLPSPPNLKYQWEAYYDKDMRRAVTLGLARTGMEMVAQPVFPDHLISRPSLRLATVVTRPGWRDYGYLSTAAKTYARYWSACEASRRPG